MADDIVALRAKGMREFIKAAAAMQRQTPKEIKAEFRQAAELVAREAQRRAPVRTGRLRNSIRPFATQREVGVREGKRAVPYAGFVDYGNKVRYKAGVGWHDSNPRRFIPTGRIMYPAFHANRNRVQQMVGEAFLTVAKRNGLEVSIHG